MTNFITGYSFLDIRTLEEPLPKDIGMGTFTASLYHKQQKQSRTEIEYDNCKESGHIRRECPYQPVCYDCSQPGHKRDSENYLGTQRRFRDTDYYAALESLTEFPDDNDAEEEEERDVDNDEEGDSDGDENDDTGKYLDVYYSKIEVLALKLKEYKEEGLEIKVGNDKKKYLHIMQFADDTTLILKMKLQYVTI